MTITKGFSIAQLFSKRLDLFLDTVAPLVSDPPKWRVTVYVNGNAQYYADWHSEILANAYAQDLRDALRNDKLFGAFVRKEMIKHV